MSAVVLILRPCAACGRPCTGSYSVHRDGYGKGPEVLICDACGSGEVPTLQEIWTAIRARRTAGRRMVSA